MTRRRAGTQHRLPHLARPGAAAFEDFAAQGAALQVLHDVEEPIAVATGRDEPDQALVIEVLHDRDLAPEALDAIRPDVIFVMNALYLNEIADTLRSIGVEAELVSVHHLMAD